MAGQAEPAIDLYVSDQWHLHGGPRSSIARQELRDRFIPIAVTAFGSVEHGLDLLLKESPYARPNAPAARKQCSRK